MLTGLTVCCGTATESCTHTVGLGREVRLQGGTLVDDPRPLTDASVYDLASLTKLFTAVAVMQLVDKGHLRLEDNMGERDNRFPALYGTKVLDIMTYEAVLRTPKRVDAQLSHDRAQEQVFATARFEGPEPAKLYSDMNALVLKYLVERISGLRFYDYLTRYILQPCGMRETWAKVPDDRLSDCVDYSFEHRIVHGEHTMLGEIPPGMPHDPKARVLSSDGHDMCGHAGLFSTAGDMVRFAQGLLSGKLLKHTTLMQLGRNRTGRMGPRYRQYLGLLVFSKSENQHLSEVPAWMGHSAFAISGYTGNHFALDPELGVFDLFLGNRCHNRVTVVQPESMAAAHGLDTRGVGWVPWTDGRKVRSSFQYYYQKDGMLHQPVLDLMKQKAWI